MKKFDWKPKKGSFKRIQENYVRSTVLTEGVNPKIKSIRTIAGNINHNELTELINITPLSKSINFGREYSSVTAAITRGLPEADFNKISGLVYDNTSEIGLNKPYRFLIDCTPHPRHYARKLVDRHITHFPNNAPGNKPICVGHQYSVLTNVGIINTLKIMQTAKLIKSFFV